MAPAARLPDSPDSLKEFAENGGGGGAALSGGGGVVDDDRAGAAAAALVGAGGGVAMPDDKAADALPGEDGGGHHGQGHSRAVDGTITPPVAAAGAAGAAAAGAGLYLSFESALVTLVLAVVSYLVFAPADHRRRLRDTLERMMCPLNVRETLRRRRMERELLKLDRESRGRQRRRRGTFHGAASREALAGLKRDVDGGAVKLLSMSPRASPPASKPEFADSSSAAGGPQLTSKRDRARLKGAASAPTLPTLPTLPSEPGAAADYISSLEPGGGAGYATHSICTGLVLEGSEYPAGAGGDELGASGRGGEEDRFATLYERSIAGSMYGKLVLPPECRLVEPPKGKKRKKGGDEGNDDDGPLGRILSFFRRIRDRVKLLMTIDYCGLSLNVFMRLAKAVQYRRNRILGRPTFEDDEDDDDDASLASLASQRSLASRGGSGVAAAAGPKPSHVPGGAGGRAKPADLSKGPPSRASLPRGPSYSSLMEAETAAPSAPRRPSSSSPAGEAPQSAPPERPSSSSSAAAGASRRPSSSSSAAGAVPRPSLPRRPSASSPTGEGVAPPQGVGGRERFYSVGDRHSQCEPSWEEKKDLGPEEERGRQTRSGGGGTTAADADENDTAPSQGRTALSASHGEVATQAPRRQETRRRRSESPTPLALRPDGGAVSGVPPRVQSGGKKRKDALESYRAKAAVPGIAAPPGPPLPKLASGDPSPSTATAPAPRPTKASPAAHLTPRPALRHSGSTPLAGGSSADVGERQAAADAGPPLNFFDAAGSTKTLQKMVREVPVPDKNGYILGDEFLPNSQCTPLLVFVNSRSGSQQGQFLLTQLRRLLNPIQVWDLADGGPETVLESFSKLTRLRILVCGGDGTVSWILSALEKMGKGQRWPPVGILPLGTGNDLARMHGWGGGYSNESLLLILEQLSEAYVSLLDRWEMTVEDRKGRVRRTKTFTNYLGVGVDAQAALQVHMLRESSPTLFFSRAVNKAWYAAAGAEDAIKASCADLPSQVTLVADGAEVPLPADSQGIILLNIDSYSGGVPLWSHGSRPLRRRDRRYSESDFTSMVCNSSPSPRMRLLGGDRVDSTDEVEIEDSLHELSYEERLARITACDMPSSCQDGMLDVVSIRGTFHLGQIRVGLSNAQLICQCKEAVIKVKKKLPVQIDGEPWRQNTCTLRVKRKQEPAIMLHRSPDESGGVETEMANLLDWAEERKIIDQTVHATLMREFSRRIESKTRQRRVRSQENLFFSMKRPKFIVGNTSL